MILLYIETRNNEVIQNDVLGTWKTEEERDLVIRQEIDLCIDNGAAANLIETLEDWDMTSPLSYQYDSRTRRFGNWVIVS